MKTDLKHSDMSRIEVVNNIIRSNNQNEIIKDKDKLSEISSYLFNIFKDQMEENTAYYHLILTEEQFNAIDKDIDFRIFGDILISVRYIGELEFIHYFNLHNIESIKEKGLLVSYSESGESNGYRPDMGYGIYVINGDVAYEMPDNLAEILFNRYDGNEEVGFVIGIYKGEYLEAINTYHHSGYYVLKDDVTLDMIKQIDSEYLSALAEDYYNYMTLDF